MRLNNLTGKRYGRLTVISESNKRNHNHVMWLVKCDCGKTKTVCGYHLVDGETTSCGCARSKTHGVASMRRAIRTYKHNAKVHNREYLLTETQFHQIAQTKCYYCGCLPTNAITKASKYGDYTYNGIDRVDNEKGYIIGNVVSCCKRCNLAKRDVSQQEFISWVKRVYHHSQHPASIPMIL